MSYGHERSSVRLQAQSQDRCREGPSTVTNHDHRPSTCASAASAWGSQKVMSMARYSSMAADSSARACSRRPILRIQRAEAEVAVGLERAHAEFLGQGEGLVVVGLRPARSPEARAAPQCRRGGAGHTPGCHVPGAHGRAPAPARRGRAPPPGGRPADAPPPGGDDRAPERRPSSIAVVCSIACVSSGTASATRPPRVYAAPKAAAILGKQAGRSAS